MLTKGRDVLLDICFLQNQTISEQEEIRGCEFEKQDSIDL
jgi:hypothetical protein